MEEPIEDDEVEDEEKLDDDDATVEEDIEEDKPKTKKVHTIPDKTCSGCAGISRYILQNQDLFCKKEHSSMGDRDHVKNLQLNLLDHKPCLQ